MEYVEIINNIPIYAPSNTYILLYLLFALISIGIISFLLYDICIYFDKKSKKKIIKMIILSLSLILSLPITIYFAKNMERPTGEYEYEVMVGDRVSLNEFCKRFEIIEYKEGNIYKVKFKENYIYGETK